MSTASGLLHSWEVVFTTFSRKIISIGVKTHSNTNLVVSRHMKKRKASLPVDTRCPELFYFALAP